MKLCTLVTVVFVTSISCLLEAQVGAPKIGFVRYADGTARAVYGLANNFITGEQIFASTDAVAFSASGGLVASHGNIHLIGPTGAVFGEYGSSETHPLLNIDGNLTTAIAYLPREQVLLRWDGKSLSPVQLSTAGLSGTVTSVDVLNTHEAELLVATSDGNISELAVSLDTGETTSVKLLPGIKGPAVLYHSWVLFQDKDGLEIEAANGTRRTVTLSHDAASQNDLVIERMAADWLHVISQTTKQSWALHLNSRVAEWAELPGLPSSSSHKRGGE
ncbi:MAG: hypothetical protein JOY62_17725 [Acidobacteriaceae bacterium]|nr:hypothetical protein [Acidobacteriaceae bacterium]MBV9781807.1 hypothetical protein [Acidobacteriaceae bacterium]